MSDLIGIIGAMDIELDGIISFMTDKTEKIISRMKYIKGKIYGKDVVVAKCGIGKVFASICAQTMIIEFHPDIIINSGVAGALTDKLSVMDVAVADKVVQHDMDTSALGDPKGFLSGINMVYIDCDKKIYELLKKSAKEVGLNVQIGVLASGDRFVTDKEDKNLISSAFGAIDCEMEGAAIGQVCYVNGIPFGVVRTISDGNGGEHDYATFAIEAADQSVKVLKKFFEIYKRGVL